MWCASTLYVLVYYPLIKLFRFKTKKTFVLTVTHHDVTPVSVRRPAQDKMIVQEWMATFGEMGNNGLSEFDHCVWIECDCGGVR